MSTVYRIRAGEVRRAAIPMEGMRIRLPGEQPGQELLALSGTEQPHWQDHTLEVVRQLATRLTPWATWWIAPEFERLGAAGYGGEAHTYRDVVVVTAQMTRRYTVFLALHEAWHAAEKRLRAEEFDAVDRAVLGGHDWRDGYFNSRVERRANLFADWSLVALETGRPMVDKARPETAVFQLVFSGGLALRLARQGSIPASRMSQDLRAAAAVPERSPRRELPVAIGGLAAVGALAWVLPWAAMAPYLAGVGVVALLTWTIWPERRATPPQ